jgi:hypothetical protein
MKRNMTSRMFAQVVAALAFTATVNTASAGYIVQQGVITQVANTASNQRNFSVTVTGGTGPCAGTVIVFPEVDAADSKAHQRAYATALLAYMTGATVYIYNYVDDGCGRASFILMVK